MRARRIHLTSSPLPRASSSCGLAPGEVSLTLRSSLCSRTKEWQAHQPTNGKHYQTEHNLDCAQWLLGSSYLFALPDR